MTIEEFSNEFDVLLSSYISARNFGVGQGLVDLDEYEKSVLLTEAQEAIVKELYTGKYTGEGFEATEELRRSLSNLVTSTTLKEISNVNPISANSYTYEIPKELLYITYESVILKTPDSECGDTTIADVYPIRQDEYNIIKNNPFRGVTNKRVLRIDSDNSTIELVSKYNIEKYYIKYLRKPNPIILIDLSSDKLSINDKKEQSEECELNEILHRPILERAVSLAIKRIPSNNSNV